MKNAPIKWLRAAGRNWSELAFIALVLLVAVPLLQNWWKQRAEESAAKERKEAEQRISTDASIAGAMTWSAYKSCTAIGIADLKACATYKGQLLQEVAAPVLAQLALDQRAAYEKKCHALKSREYCYNLLNRAFQLSRAAPAGGPDN